MTSSSKHAQDKDQGLPRTLSELWSEPSLPSKVSVSLNPEELSHRQKSWQRICAKLRNTDGEEFYQRRLALLSLGANSTHKHIRLNGQLRLSDKQRLDLEVQLLPLWQSEHMGIERLSLELNSDAISIRWDSQLNFDRFVVGDSNKLAHAAAKKMAESENAPYTPLYLFGGVGLGKTHLMTAIALESAKRFPDQKILFMTAEGFMRQFVDSLYHKNTRNFKQSFHSADILLIDDIHFLANKKSTQEEFFHILNGLIDQRKKIIVASDRSPHHIVDLDPRVCSRLASGLVAEIQSADKILRTRYLDNLSQQHKLPLPSEVIDFMAAELPISIRELEGAVNRLSAYADLMGEPLDRNSISVILRDILHQPKLRLRIDTIQKHVADYYHIERDDLISSSRKRLLVRPRQLAMYLCKELTPRSLPEIGRKFGNRDHTTVLHAISKIKQLCAENSNLLEDIHQIKQRLQR